MPIATPEVYNQMLDAAKAGEYAFPAINVTSSETLNAALRGFAEAESDGIIQMSTGGTEFLSGTGVRRWPPVRSRWPSSPTWLPPSTRSTWALHTDHCPKDKLDGWSGRCWR